MVQPRSCFKLFYQITKQIQEPVLQGPEQKRFHRCDFRPLTRPARLQKSESRDWASGTLVPWSISVFVSGLMFTTLGSCFSTPFRHIIFPRRWPFTENNFPAAWNKMNSKGKCQTEVRTETWDLLLHCRRSRAKKLWTSFRTITLIIIIFFYLSTYELPGKRNWLATICFT